MKSGLANMRSRSSRESVCFWMASVSSGSKLASCRSHNVSAVRPVMACSIVIVTGSDPVPTRRRSVGAADPAPGPVSASTPRWTVRFAVRVVGYVSGAALRVPIRPVTVGGCGDMVAKLSTLSVQHGAIREND